MFHIALKTLCFGWAKKENISLTKENTVTINSIMKSYILPFVACTIYLHCWWWPGLSQFLKVVLRYEKFLHFILNDMMSSLFLIDGNFQIHILRTWIMIVWLFNGRILTGFLAIFGFHNLLYYQLSLFSTLSLAESYIYIKKTTTHFNTFIKCSFIVYI